MGLLTALAEVSFSRKILFESMMDMEITDIKVKNNRSQGNPKIHFEQNGLRPCKKLEMNLDWKGLFQLGENQKKEKPYSNAFAN